MFDDYTEASKLFANVIQRLLDDVHEKKKEGGPERNRLENLAGLLAKQLKQIKEIKPCIIKLDREQEEVEPVQRLTEDSIPQKAPSTSPNRRRRNKKYAEHAKPKSKRIPPTNRSREKVKQAQNKTRKIRSEATDGCTGKNKLSYDQAVADGSRILEESRDPSLRRMAVYYCLVCGNHHLTRQVHSPGKKGSTQVAVLTKEAVA